VVRELLAVVSMSHAPDMFKVIRNRPVQCTPRLMMKSSANRSRLLTRKQDYRPTTTIKLYARCFRRTSMIAMDHTMIVAPIRSFIGSGWVPEDRR
jgi:hypothetical protein